MDTQPKLNFARPMMGSRVAADQAIFTSTPSNFAEGYRIVAASQGLRPEERAEITRWSPSHGNMCTGEGAPEAITSYRLRTGRHCIAHSQPAGMEHTGRGSELIYTHLTILSEQDFAAFGCNPLLLRSAVMQRVGSDPILKPQSLLEPLALELEGNYAVSRGVFAHIEVDRLCTVASKMLSGKRLVVAGARSSLAALEWTLMILPLSVRQRLAASANLKYSHSRTTDLAWVNHDQGETQRLIAGQNVQFMDVAGLVGEEALPACEWFGLMRRWWREGRWDDICGLTFELSMPITTADLDRIARVCHALDSVSKADSATIKDWETQYAQSDVNNAVESKLIRKLQDAILSRIAVPV